MCSFLCLLLRFYFDLWFSGKPQYSFSLYLPFWFVVGFLFFVFLVLFCFVLFLSFGIWQLIFFINFGKLWAIFSSNISVFSLVLEFYLDMHILLDLLHTFLILSFVIRVFYTFIFLYSFWIILHQSSSDLIHLCSAISIWFLRPSNTSLFWIFTL